MKHIIKFIYAFIIVALTSYIAGFFTRYGIAAWYDNLPKPSLTPPNSWFPVIWSILYFLMAVSFALVLVRAEFNCQRKINRIFVGQLLLQVIWCFVFFYLGYIGLAFVIIFFLDVIVFKMIQIFGTVDKKASWLLYPYFWWLAYASFLNFVFLYFYGAIISF